MVNGRRLGVTTAADDKRADEEASLESAADELLAKEGFALGDIPLLTERGLLRKMRREMDRAPVLPEDALSEQECEYLIERYIRQLGKDKKLTRMQLRVYELFLRRLPLSDIAQRLGLTRQRVRHALQTARSHEDNKQGKYDGLQQIYWREVRRYVYRKPRHAWEQRTDD